jgi:hypothetical protein
MELDDVSPLLPPAAKAMLRYDATVNVGDDNTAFKSSSKDEPPTPPTPDIGALVGDIIVDGSVMTVLKTKSYS